jgi:hypothetical protein
VSEMPGGPGWWIASDGRWYPPELHPAARAAPPASLPAPGMPHPDGVPSGPPSVVPKLPPGALRVVPPGSDEGYAVESPAAGRRRRRIAAAACVIAAVVLAAVVVDEVIFPAQHPPPEGTAVVVRGQPTNILPDPDFLGTCSSSHFDDSSTCVTTTLEALNHAGAEQALAPIVLPTNWTRLTPAEQLFVATNLERTARGLAPVTAMAASLDSVAADAAAAGTDPQFTAGGSFTAVGANWIQGYSNPLEVLYEWLYDDGLGSSNVDCSRQDLSACWGHRANVLLNLNCPSCALGAAYAPTDRGGRPLSFAELLVESSAPAAVVFSWDQERPYLG